MMKHYLLLCLLSLCILTGCTNQPSVSQTQSNQATPIKIGAIAPLSNLGTTYGEDVATMLALLEKRHNQAHPEHPIQLIIEDGKCSGKDATSAAQKLINVDKVVAMLGGVCSSEAVSAGRVAQENKILSIIPASQAPSISNVGNYVIRFANAVQGAKMMADSVNKNFTKPGLIWENTEYGKSISDELRKYITFTKEVKFESSEADFDLLAKKVEQELQTSTDGIVLITQSEASTTKIISALMKNGFTSTYPGKIFGHSFIGSNAFLKNIGTGADGMYNIKYVVAEQNAEFKEIMTEYRSNYEVQSFDGIAAVTAEGFELLADCIIQGSTTSDQIYSCVRSLTPQKPRNGFFGSYYLSGNDAVGLPYKIEKIVNGKPLIIDDISE